MSNSNNKSVVPEAREAGSIGGQMVNNIYPVRHMIFTRKYRTVKGYERQITYGFRVVV